MGLTQRSTLARDRGEELHKPIAEKTWGLVMENLDAEYNYLFENGKWYCKYHDRETLLLTQKLINETGLNNKTNMDYKYTYEELEVKFGPHTAELQRRWDYGTKYLGLLDMKFTIDEESIAKAKAEGKTTEQMTESLAQELLAMEAAPTVQPDKEFF